MNGYLKIWFSDIKDAEDFFDGNQIHLAEFLLNVYREYAELPTKFRCKLVEKYFKSYRKQIDFVKKAKELGKEGGLKRAENEILKEHTLEGGLEGDVQGGLEYTLEAKDKSKKIKDKVLNTKEEIINLFNDFWSIYPTKIARSKCEKKFLSLTENERLEIKQTLLDFVKYKPFENYSHPHPETYINQKRWQDVLPNASKKVEGLKKEPNPNHYANEETYLYACRNAGVTPKNYHDVN